MAAALKRGTNDAEAYQLYLKGRFYWARRPQGINKAIGYFEQAIEKDPRSAVARAAPPIMTGIGRPRKLNSGGRLSSIQTTQ